MNFNIEIDGSIAALLAAAIYHGTTGSGISYTQRNIDYICRYYRSIATAQADYVPRFIFVFGMRFLFKPDHHFAEFLFCCRNAKHSSCKGHSMAYHRVCNLPLVEQELLTLP